MYNWSAKHKLIILKTVWKYNCCSFLTTMTTCSLYWTTTFGLDGYRHSAVAVKFTTSPFCWLVRLGVLEYPPGITEDRINLYNLSFNYCKNYLFIVQRFMFSLYQQSLIESLGMIKNSMPYLFWHFFALNIFVTQYMYIHSLSWIWIKDGTIIKRAMDVCNSYRVTYKIRA